MKGQNTDDDGNEEIDDYLEDTETEVTNIFL